MANGKARALHRSLEAERAPKQKCDEILSPQASDLRWLLGQSASPIDTVSRDLGTNIASGSHMARVPAPGVGHIQDRAGLGITLAKTQEIKREIFGHDDQVRLKVIWRETPRWTGQQARSCLGSNVRAAKRVGAHVTSFRTAACRSRNARAMPANGTNANKRSPLLKLPLAPLRRPIA
jgi:hypothetical protein